MGCHRRSAIRSRLGGCFVLLASLLLVVRPGAPGSGRWCSVRSVLGKQLGLAWEEAVDVTRSVCCLASGLVGFPSKFRPARILNRT